MTYDEIQYAILKVYKDCNIQSFPINCFDILEQMGIVSHAYSSLSDSKRHSCLLISEDAFVLKNEVYYNDTQLVGRMRFSLMHELGHIVLEHSKNRTELEEIEANYFASNIIAPRMAIHYANCKNEVHVANLFELTYEAAGYAFSDYRKWHRNAVYKMKPIDHKMYQHFYNKEAKQFVYKIHNCIWCNQPVFNEDGGECKKCIVRSKYLCHEFHTEQDFELKVAEDNWLYQE